MHKNSTHIEGKQLIIKKSRALSKTYQAIVHRRLWLIAGILVTLLFSLLLDLMTGPSGMPITSLWQAIFFPSEVDIMTKTIVWDIRLPYALVAVVVGLSLGLAGAEMQTILNNPLASPFTLGVSSAASFGAALAIILGIGIPGIPPQWFIPVNAFIFALLATLLLDQITRWLSVSTAGIVLFGIALVFTFNAMVLLLKFIAREDTLQDLIFWTMGSLTRATWHKFFILFTTFLLLIPFSIKNAWKMTAFRFGEERAISFGIEVKKLRLHTLLRVSILSALTVAFVGPIGFIGLVAPHIARLIFGEDHRFFLPASAFCGALILSAASVLSKNLVHGVIVPVGIVTSLVGIPFFLAIIYRYRGEI